ncbi:Uncharacterised protein [Mycobacterium tuberculosis]|nr:Uncharacterised protein [Mycobacterium tuberculosis]
MASVGTCWPGLGASSRCTQTAAPPTRAAPRSSRSTAQRWTAPCQATRSSSKAASAIASRTPARWGQCSSCPALGLGTPPTAMTTVWLTRRTCSTPRWPQPATCVAVGSTCATRRRSWPRSCATTTRCLTPRTYWAGPPATPPVCSRLTCPRSPVRHHHSATRTSRIRRVSGPACRSMSTA